MRLRNIPGSREVIGESPYVIQNPKECLGTRDPFISKWGWEKDSSL